MGNANRYRRGPRMLVKVPVASSTVIEKGDFVLIVSGKAITPHAQLADGSEQASAKAAGNVATQYFAGIAEDASASGDTDPILVDISQDAIFELKQATAAAISFGDRVEIYAYSTASSSWTLSDDSIAAGTNNPIAVCVEQHTSAQGAGTLCRLLPQKLLNNASWN